MATTTAAPRSCDEVMSWARDITDQALRTAVGTLPPAVRRVADYHLGWRDRDGNPAAASSGKAIRPTLTLLMAQAAGGAYESALPAAVAVELVHNHSLLHDDVMDGDLLRRHRPTAWSVFGVGPAILARDALLALAFDVLAASGAHEAVRVLNATTQQLLEGQIEDVGFETRDDVSLAECIGMARAKTGALLGCACALGGLLATGERDRVAHAQAFGEQLGLAFQLVDDVLGIWGDPAVTGKAAHSDLRARKKSLPVVAALTSGTPAGDELARLYASPGELSTADVAAAAELVTESGGRAWSEAQAREQLAAALADLHRAGAHGQAAGELEAIARLVTTRDR